MMVYVGGGILFVAGGLVRMLVFSRKRATYKAIFKKAGPLAVVLALLMVVMSWPFILIAEVDAALTGTNKKKEGSNDRT